MLEPALVDEPHRFRPGRVLFWRCRLCYAPRVLHPLPTCQVLTWK